MDKLRLGRKKKRMIFVDSENFWGVRRVIEEGNKKLNQSEFFKLLAKDGESRVFYYFSPKEIKDNDDAEKDPFLRWMDHIFNELRPNLEKAQIPCKIFLAIGTTVDSKIITGIAKVLIKDKESLGEIVVVSGDRTFAEILEAAKDEKVRVKVVAGRHSCSFRLKEEGVSDEVVFIEDIVEDHPSLLQTI